MMSSLAEAIAATGMTPPRNIVEGRWLRFPGVGKGRGNRAGWCRVITPTLAIYGDWSSGLCETWRDDTHRDDERTRELLKQARERERRFAAEQRAKQASAAKEAQQLVRNTIVSGHPYLVRKGFPNLASLVREGKLVIPVRDVDDYRVIISAQLIAEDGDKKFLPGGRTRGGIYRIGDAWASRVALCEGYATGLSVHAALSRLYGACAVVACFSAYNLEYVASRFPGALVCADNDHPNKLTGEKAGEAAAQRTGLPWVMPAEIGTDFNDLHLKRGLYAVMDVLRAF